MRASFALNLDNNEKVTKLVLEENGLYKKKIPEGRNSLMKAISDSLFFTTKYHDRILKQCVEHLNFLLSTNSLPSKLNHFRNSSYLLKDYCETPSLPGFEKINLELISLIYNKQIKVYSVNWDDLTLQAMIVNNKYTKKIELFKNLDSDNYETVYPIDHMKNVAFGQNLIFNI